MYLIFFQAAQIYLVGTKADLVEKDIKQRAVELSVVAALAKGDILIIFDKRKKQTLEEINSTVSQVFLMPPNFCQ